MASGDVAHGQMTSAFRPLGWNTLRKASQDDTDPGGGGGREGDRRREGEREDGEREDERSISKRTESMDVWSVLVSNSEVLYVTAQLIGGDGKEP